MSAAERRAIAKGGLSQFRIRRGRVEQRIVERELHPSNATMSAYIPMDTRTPQQRRRIMQAVKSRDTKPEIIVRRCLHSMGYRYRLHRKDLPGRPDIVFGSRRKAIFVHGCFWHRHDCAKGRLPKSRLNYWKPKLDENVIRDKTRLEELDELGWQTLVIWQCELDDLEALAARLQDFVGER